MKKQLITLSLLMIGTGAALAQTKTAGKPAATKTQAAEPAVSANMKSFLGMFNGDYKMVEEAFTKFEKEGLNRHNIDMYDLVQPVVKTAEINDKQEKYLVEVKSGVTTRKMEIYWEGGKISEVKDLGIK